MTAEQFEEAKNLRDDEFAACCELNPEFEVEFYSWVDYFTVLKLQEQQKPIAPTNTHEPGMMRRLRGSVNDARP